MKKTVHFLLAVIIFICFSSSAAFALTPSQIFDRNSDSVVKILTEYGDGSAASASGFFIDGDGLVVTNYHVIADAANIIIELKNGAMAQVIKIVAQDPEIDLALIQARLTGTKPLKIAQKIPSTGEKVYVIGAPRGFTHTLSDGILSAVRGSQKEHIQITAPISHGSSGSPVFDSNGEVVGVVSFFIDGQNLNFAPSASALRAFLHQRPMRQPRAESEDAANRQSSPRNSAEIRSVVPGEFILKSGNYSEEKVLRLKQPIKSTLPGTAGIHFWFEITEPCTLEYVYSREGYEFFAAPDNIIKSTYAGLSVIARGDLVGVYRDPKSGGMGWFVDNSKFNKAYALWTRKFKEKEFPMIEEDTEIFYDDRDVRIIKYIGVDDVNLEFLLVSVQNGKDAEIMGTQYYPIDKMPGSVEIYGGTLYLDSLKGTRLYYSWEEK